MNANPYDQIPYYCQPIEWTAPERLALTSLLHGGPVPDLKHYRVLELGCGDGANLIPMAFYRSQAEFIGVDGCTAHIDIAHQRLAQLSLDNLQFLHQDFTTAVDQLPGQFDFIIVHGVFSWVPDPVRDALFQLCRDKLHDNGLLYLNYNTRPGWNIRGMVRDYLLDHTEKHNVLTQKVQHARIAATQMARALASSEHPFSRLLANEFQFVCDNHDSYIAHEFLAQDNHAYWRSEFLALAARYGLNPVADADYNYASGRIDPSLSRKIQALDLAGTHLTDTMDLISYRQLHTPILSKRRARAMSQPSVPLRDMQIASCLYPVGLHKPQWYQHPNGYQVEVRESPIAEMLDQLLALWPHGAPLDAILDHSERYRDDLILLHNNGLLELRLPDGPRATPHQSLNRLNQLELSWGDFCTNDYHQRLARPAPPMPALKGLDDVVAQ